MGENLAGRVAVVTGGASGIGEACATRLAEVAELVADLCSAPASFANGASYLLDGGWSAR